MRARACASASAGTPPLVAGLRALSSPPPVFWFVFREGRGGSGAREWDGVRVYRVRQAGRPETEARARPREDGGGGRDTGSPSFVLPPQPTLSQKKREGALVVPLQIRVRRASSPEPNAQRTLAARQRACRACPALRTGRAGASRGPAELLPKEEEEEREGGEGGGRRGLCVLCVRVVGRSRRTKGRRGALALSSCVCWEEGLVGVLGGGVEGRETRYSRWAPKQSAAVGAAASRSNPPLAARLSHIRSKHARASATAVARIDSFLFLTH